jgi:hypothetical protein
MENLAYRSAVLEKHFLKFVQAGQDGSECQDGSEGVFRNYATDKLEYRTVRSIPPSGARLLESIISALHPPQFFCLCVKVDIIFSWQSVVCMVHNMLLACCRGRYHAICNFSNRIIPVNRLLNYQNMIIKSL